MGGGADGAFPRNPRDAGDRDRAVLRRGGAGAARLPAGVRAPRRPRGQRRAAAGGGGPGGGGADGGYVPMRAGVESLVGTSRDLRSRVVKAADAAEARLADLDALFTVVQEEVEATALD